jgi:hypothetical protein
MPANGFSGINRIAGINNARIVPSALGARLSVFAFTKSGPKTSKAITISLFRAGPHSIEK